MLLRPFIYIHFLIYLRFAIKNRRLKAPAYIYQLASVNLGEAAHEVHEFFRNGDAAVGILVVFEHCREGPADCEARAVQRVDVLGMLGDGVAVADVRPSRLEVFAVGAGRDFHVAAVARHPHFDVIGLGGREADVPGAQFHDAVRNLQLF